jgi:N-acetylglucosaminyl-diphospho-decaprenol L-rhamnosyltransferase
LGERIFQWARRTCVQAGAFSMARTAEETGYEAAGRGAAGGDAQMSVVVVSYNTKALTLQCVDSLCATMPQGTAVCVVDNASSDGSVCALEQLAQSRGDLVQVIRAGRNMGFGAANNLGAASTRSEFIALVNSDAFVGAGALEGLRAYLQRTPRAAIVGPRLENADGSFQESRFVFPSPTRAWIENLGLARLKRFLTGTRPAVGGPVSWLSGACLMVRREVWEDAGGFDESFFLYAEETDLQKRITALGWEIHWAPDFVVTHIGGSSGLAEREVVRERFFEGADRYILRYHGRLGAWVFRAATACGALLRWGACALRGGAQGKSARRWAWIFRRQVLSSLPKGADGTDGKQVTAKSADRKPEKTQPQE